MEQTEIIDSSSDPKAPPKLTITRRNDRSAYMATIQFLLRPFRPRTVKPSKIFPPESPHLDPPRRITRKCTVEKRKVEDIWLYDITSKEGAPADRKRRIFYFCGGGWQMPPSTSHWGFVGEMATRVPSATVTLISYPLAPKSPASKTLPMLWKLYPVIMEDSVKRGEEVVFAGDSSGGNIALSLVLWALKTNGKPHPTGVMAICPTVDLRHQDPRIEEIDRRDPILTRKSIKETASSWTTRLEKKVTGESSKTGSEDDIAFSTSDPHVSPGLAHPELFATNNVKVHGVTCGWDVLSPEAMVFRDTCMSKGVEGEWLEWDKQMHCFPLAYAYKLRESIEAKDWVIDVLSRTWGDSPGM